MILYTIKACRDTLHNSIINTNHCRMIDERRVNLMLIDIEFFIMALRNIIASHRTALHHLA